MKETASGKLTGMQRFDYAIGDFGYNFMYYWVSAFLLIFYTDVFGINPAHATTLLLVVRLYDAVNDPLIGSLADRTKSKWGRYKPWIFWGSIALAVSIVFLFWAHPDWNYTAKVIYMYVTYILVTTFSTCSNMAYGALNGVITPDGGERLKASSLRMTFMNTAVLVIGFIAVPLRTSLGGGNESKGYLLTEPFPV